MCCSGRTTTVKLIRQFFKVFFWSIAILLISANAFIIFSGRTYLYKGLANTYLKGRSGPSATEYTIFHNRVIAAGTPQIWPKTNKYNTSVPDQALWQKIESLETGSFVVSHHDSLVFEKYALDFNDTTSTNSFSMAKTVVSVLIGCALQDGSIASIDEPAAKYVSEMNTPQFKNITIRHLLNMSSGIAFDEDYVNPLAYPAEAYYGTNLRKQTFVYTDTTVSPGKYFEYLSGNTQLLGFVLKAATKKSVAEYASEKLWKPLGCERDAYWSLDDEGGEEKAFCCFNSNARDFARIGKLYLDSGRWNGVQIVPEWYALESVKTQGLRNDDGTPNTNYGLTWWLIPKYKGKYVFYARGILGQYILCVPEDDLIVVRLGQKRLSNDSDDTPQDVYHYLDAAWQIIQSK